MASQPARLLHHLSNMDQHAPELNAVPDWDQSSCEMNSNVAMLASCGSPLCCFELTKAKSGFWKASGSECLVELRKNLWQAQQASCFILQSLKCWRGQWPISTHARRRGNYQRMSLGYMEWIICCDLWLHNWSRLTRELMEGPWSIIKRGDVIIFRVNPQGRPSVFP